MRLSARAPCRVDVAGGTLDIWPLYLYHPGAVTVNFAINCYASCVLETHPGPEIILESRDLKKRDVFPSLEALCEARRYRLSLPAYLIRFFAPRVGFKLSMDSEAPVGGGIAGSSTLIIAIASVLNRLTGAGYALEQIREICQNIEAQIIRVPTGSQDYYPAMYGGVNAIELTPAGIFRKPIAVDLEDFNQRIVLAYTGKPRESGINNWKVMKAHINGNRKVHRNFDRIAAIAQAMRSALERSDWREAGRLLREEWGHRRRNHRRISTPLIDRLVQLTRRAGALGAKACGAGGGGCVFFLVERGAAPRVAEIIRQAGARVLPVSVASEGVQVDSE